MPGRRKKSKEALLKEKYYKKYKSWKKVFCIPLKSDVHFTNKGWHHLQNEKWRTKSEKEQRLKLLQTAKLILTKTTTIQSKRVQNYHDTPHNHYQFTALIGGVVVTVIVIEDKLTKQYDFLSVFRVNEVKR